MSFLSKAAVLYNALHSKVEFQNTTKYNRVTYAILSMALLRHSFNSHLVESKRFLFFFYFLSRLFLDY